MLIENEGVHPLYVIGRDVLEDGVDLDFLLLHCCQVRTNIVLTCFMNKIFKLSLFSLVINHDLWLNYVQHHLEKDDTTFYAPISNFISIHELLIVGLKGGVAGSFHVIFDDEVGGAAELLKLNLVLVDKAEVSRYIWVNGMDLHVHVCDKVGPLFLHKPF